MDRLAQFRDAHAKGRLLVLPNAWDAASARMAADAGAKAIATSSAAVAWCHGYADGETMPRDVVMTATREVLRVVDLPVTVDSEAGYSDDPAKVADHVMGLIDLGVAGINLEDGTGEAGLLVAKIEAIKSAAKTKGSDIFINARSDVYLANLVPDDAKLAEIVRRGVLYRDAGANGFFAPAVTQIKDIREIVDAVDLPVNILDARRAADRGDENRRRAPHQHRRFDRESSVWKGRESDKSAAGRRQARCDLRNQRRLSRFQQGVRIGRELKPRPSRTL
ncbi:MAG TPA: isocitrate lyase/phosphoenolpyruvate mutase family protein [Rhizomicrobium sp.]|jgi:2-methylisocitrate lyase-like PEP mutase family enzyme